MQGSLGTLQAPGDSIRLRRPPPKKHGGPGRGIRKGHEVKKHGASAPLITRQDDWKSLGMVRPPAAPSELGPNVCIMAKLRH